MLALDHIVFASSDLTAGTAWMSDRLGLDPQGGGAHPLFGTHNALWPLGEVYLELIAIDPAAPDPDRPRLFELDQPAMQARIADRPCLVHWVLRTDDATAALTQIGYDPGPPIEMTRGTLHWRLTVRDDGSMANGGCLPSVVEWPPDVTRPPQAMDDRGLRLGSFEVSANADTLRLVPDIARVRTRAGARGLAVDILRADATRVTFSDQI